MRIIDGPNFPFLPWPLGWEEEDGGRNNWIKTVMFVLMLLLMIGSVIIARNSRSSEPFPEFPNEDNSSDEV